MASKRTEEMTSFIVMDVLERACELECEGKDIVHLEVGRAGLRHAGMRQGGGLQGAEGRVHPLHPQPGHAGAARGDLRVLP